MARNQAELRKHFNQQLRDIWNEWDGHDFPGSPFRDVNESHPFWNNAGFNYDVGYLTGISAATGWSVARPKG